MKISLQKIGFLKLNLKSTIKSLMDWISCELYQQALLLGVFLFSLRRSGGLGGETNNNSKFMGIY